MAKVKVRLLKPLNGSAIGSEAEYDQTQLARLIGLGAVEVIKGAAPAKGKAKTKAKGATPLNKMEPAPLNKGADAATSPPAGGETSTEDETKG